MNFKKLNSQSGRSMVEMLGVLAIIGVLSVGGIAGYSLSMRRHRANGVVDLVNKYALIAYNACQQKILNGEITDTLSCKYDTSFNNADIGNIPAGVNDFQVDNITIDSNTNDDSVTIGVFFNDAKLCQAVGSISGTSCTGGSSIYITIKQN